MKLNVSYLYCVCIIFLVSCSEPGNDKNEVIASLKGEEIRVSDVLTQYPVEGKYIEIYLKEEIVIREAKNRGISITEQEIKELKGLLYPSDQPSQIEDFHGKQADFIGITAEEYFEIWSTTYLERNEYIQAYIKSEFGEPSSENVEDKWGSSVQSHIDELFEDYQENKELIIHNIEEENNE
ncbi:hypothetical protein ACQCT5_03010 [Sutcliffiella halmapala]